MSTVPNQFLVNVPTYQDSQLAYLYNEFIILSKSNKKYNEFNKMPANLGSTVTFDLPSRSRNATGLIITKQAYNQRVQSLSVTQAFNNTRAFSAQEFIFNVEDYMEKFGKNAMNEMGSGIEADLLKNFDSSVTVNDPEAPNFGTNVSADFSGPFRFFGDGVNPINTFNQLAQALANFADFGMASMDVNGLIPVSIEPSIVGTGLQQFVPERNEKLAESWQIGRFGNCMWNRSNLLPIHYSGTIGDAGGNNNLMTVVSTNDPTGQNITQITFTEPTSGTSARAIEIGDLMEVEDGVGSFPDLRFRTFIGHTVTNQPVQMVATRVAASTAGSVTVTFRTATGIGLVSAANENQNLNFAIQAGMKVRVMPSHRVGAIWSGNQIYVAMPALPDQPPFPTSVMVDPESGASMRAYYGAEFGKNSLVYVTDCIWGSCVVPEYCMRLLFPLNQ